MMSNDSSHASTKTNTTTLPKKNSILNLSKHRIPERPTHALANTQSVKNVMAKLHSTALAQPVMPPKPDAAQGKKQPAKKQIEASRPSNPQQTEHKVKEDAKRTSQVVPKAVVPLTQIQCLLKANITPKAVQTQRMSLATERQKKVDASPKKPQQISSTVKIPSKQPSTSQVTLVTGPVLISKEPKLKPSASPKHVEKPKEPTFPMSVAQALKLFADQLSDYDKGEILDYKEIYFMGKNLGRKGAMSAKGKERNNGFDDDKGDYNAYVGDQVAYRYEIIDMLGKGSFGQAIKCYDHKTKEHVALKIIRSKKRFYHQATVEIKILKYIRDNDTKGHSNVIKMMDYFTFRKHIVNQFIYTK